MSYSYCDMISNEYQKIFENIEPDDLEDEDNDDIPPRLKRACRTAWIPSNINDVQLGYHCIIYTEGSGYCQWYYYYRLDGRHMLIFRSPNGVKNFNYDGRQISSRPRYSSQGIHFGNEPPINGHTY